MEFSRVLWLRPRRADSVAATGSEAFYLCLICTDLAQHIKKSISHFYLAVKASILDKTRNCLYHVCVVCLYKWLLWIMAAVQDCGDKLIRTAVEKIHFTDCQNLHSCLVYLGRQTPNINLSWGGAHATCTPCMNIQSSPSALFAAQHDSHNKRTCKMSKLMFLIGLEKFVSTDCELQTWITHSRAANGEGNRPQSVWEVAEVTEILWQLKLYVKKTIVQNKFFFCM